MHVVDRDLTQLAVFTSQFFNCDAVLPVFRCYEAHLQDCNPLLEIAVRLQQMLICPLQFWDALVNDVVDKGGVVAGLLHPLDASKDDRDP